MVANPCTRGDAASGVQAAPIFHAQSIPGAELDVVRERYLQTFCGHESWQAMPSHGCLLLRGRQ